MKAFLHRLVCSLFLLTLAYTAAGATETAVLEYTVTGVRGELRENINAWLGDPPESTQARSNFLFTAHDRVESSLKALGYYNAEIELKITREEPVWRLEVAVTAGEPVVITSVDIQISGEARQDEAFQRLLSEQPLRVGAQLNHGEFDTFRARILSLGQSRGYFHGAVTASQVRVETRGNTAEVQFHYDSSDRFHFGDIAFASDFIAPNLLSPLVVFSPGDPYDQVKLQESQAQLQRTGYFSTVILRPDLNRAADGVVPLELQVFPAKRHSFDVGLGFSTDTRERVSLTWRTPKLNRLGHSQETRLQYSEVNPSGRFTYSIPMTHPLNDVVQLAARWENNEFGDLDSDQFELGVRREKKRKNWLYSYHVRALNEAWTVVGEHQENDYLLPGFSLSRRNISGSLVNPDSAFSQLYRFEVAGADFGSDIDMQRATVNLGYIQSFADRHRMVSRLEMGAAFVSREDRTSLAPSLNFFAGGSQSIRGFSYQSIGNEVTLIDSNGDERTIVVGGDRLLTGSVEYQYRVNENWRGALFADGGDAFDEGDFNVNYAAGFGVHYITQVGAIRLELAYPLSEDDADWRFHLAIGAEF